MDQQLLEQVVDELAECLRGARVDRIIHMETGGICLCLHRQRSRTYLLLAPDRQLPRIHLLSARPKGVRSPSRFVLFLRKHLTRARIDEIRIINGDRVVVLRCTHSTGPVQLVFELTGASANIIVTGADDRVLAVLHERPLEREDGRVLLPGTSYRPPAKPGVHARTLRSLPSLPPLSAVSPTPVNEAAEALFDRLRDERDTAALRQHLQSTIRQAVKRTERRISAITEDLSRSERAEEHQAAGSAILANLARLQKGMERAVLVDHGGQAIEVDLDPAKGPTENAEAHFRRSKKAKAARAHVQERLADAQEEADLLRLALEDIPRASDRRALDAVRGRLQRYGLIREPGARRSSRTAAPSPLFRTVQFEGWDILIGRSAASNDHITRNLARPDDLWLHAEGMPGSHVLVRNPGRLAVPPSVLRRAAALAAYFSKGKGASKVPVTYTAARYVSRPKGAKPGLAVLSRRESIMVTPEPL